MPKYLDSHMDIDVDDDMLSNITKNGPADEFGVVVRNILYNKEIDYIFCLLEAPYEEAIRKYHEQFNIKCDNILEIKEI